MDLLVNLHKPHNKQGGIKSSPAKRKVIRGGRRSGKTTLMSDIAVEHLLLRKRVLYATPTQEQLDRFWFLTKAALRSLVEAKVFYKNETRHIIEKPGTVEGIRAKTAWDADTLRGDYGDLIILDEFQDMKPEVLEYVVYPMLLDNDGDLVIIYTSKRGKKGKHTRDLYKQAAEDSSGRWAAFHMTSLDNPHLDQGALQELSRDMSSLAYRAEILAEDFEDDPDALWNRNLIDQYRATSAPDLVRVVVGVDPPGGTRTECGIVVAGSGYIGRALHAFVLDDSSLAGSPGEWGKAVATAYHRTLADRILGESNYGGDMVEATLRAVDPNVSYAAVTATRGKAVRAEPVVAQYEQGRVHHIGEFPELEDELCNWVPDTGMSSPNRLDALVWAITELLGLGSPPFQGV